MSNSLHPIFEQCAKLTLDEYWKDIFLNASQNIFPKGVRYDSKSNILFIRTQLQSGKIITEPAELGKTPEATFKIVLEIFKERLNIFSPLDIQVKKSELTELKESRMSSLDCEWKDIKPRSLKELIITRYIINLKKKHNLSDKNTKKAYVTLQLGFQLKQLYSDDVVYKKMAIQNIEGFVYDEETKEFKVTRPIPQSTKKEKKNPSRKFEHTINAYITECKNKRYVL